MKKALIAALGFFQIANPALALSCGTLDPAIRFNALQSQPETYVLGLGKLHYLMAAGSAFRPEPMIYNFTGIFLGPKEADDRVQEAQQVVTGNCRSGCPIWPPLTDQETLVFLVVEKGYFRLTSEGCELNFFASPTPVQIDALRRCVENGVCGPEEIAAFAE